jgi:hypothetical protein
MTADQTTSRAGHIGNYLLGDVPPPSHGQL